MNDVVILIPGIMGSALAKEGRVVWDVSSGAIGRALYSLGSSIHELALTSDASTGEGVMGTHLLANLHLFPGFWKIDGYSGLSSFIRSRVGTIPGENYFEFPYDWRLDNRVSAARLETAALGWLETWRSRGKNGARLVLIAHSMGGLVARYFLECLGGWRHTKMLITLGTPYRGSVKALDYLVNGNRKKIGPITIIDLTKLVRSFPSVHQLLPIYPCVGKTEDELTRLEDLPELGELDMLRARAGIDFHREIELAVRKNRAHPDYATSGYRLLPIVGTYQPTYLSALIANGKMTPLKTYKGETLLEGDGTVPRLSATPIEFSGAGKETFVACPHASLQNFDPARTQLRAALEDVDISEIKAVGLEPISIEIDDVFSASEPVRARARCAAALDPMQASITNLDTGEETQAELGRDQNDDDWQRLALPPLPAGAYRIDVDAGEEAEPITDLFAVLDDAG